MPQDRVEQLIGGTGNQPKDDEVETLAGAFGLDPKELVTAPLYDVLKGNLKHLLEDLPRGERGHLARSLGITQSQLSRWVTTAVRPERANLTKLLRYFEIDPDCDLQKEPLFLHRGPVGSHAKKRWLIRRIEAAPPEVISKHFPTMELVFQAHANH